MSVMKKLFDEFEKNNVEYAHFKSNCNLDDSFLKKGDFDVLVNPMHLGTAEKIITNNNGKRYNAFNFGRYPGVDNWLLFDDENGDIKHLHLHCQIASGKSLVKDYVIPWSDAILETRIKDDKYDIYITDPNLEILLLLVRSIIKSKIKDCVKARIGCYHTHQSLKEEWDALQNVIEFKKVDGFIDKLFDKKYSDYIKKVIRQKEITGKNYKKLNRIIRKTFVNYRRVSGCAASFTSFVQNRIRKYQIILNWHTKSCYLIQKTSMTSGAIIAFVGVDGAGKSTTTDEIHKWLAHKIECKRFYMGAGEGNKPLYVRVTDKILGKRANSAVKSSVKKSEESKKENLNSGGSEKVKTLQHLSFIKSKAKAFWASRIYSIEKKNYKSLIRMNKYRLNGGISLLDRYPQMEYAGRNDGPKIDSIYAPYEKTNAVKQKYEKENQLLSIVKEIKPDVIFRLNITAEESMKRKSEQVDISEFEQKIEDLKQITFQNANIIDIDAALPYEEELLEIKKVIWKYI